MSQNITERFHQYDSNSWGGDVPFPELSSANERLVHTIELHDARLDEISELIGKTTCALLQNELMDEYDEIYEQTDLLALTADFHGLDHEFNMSTEL